MVLAAVALKQLAAGDFTMDMKPQHVIQSIHAEDDVKNIVGKQIIVWNKQLAKSVYLQTQVAYQEGVVLSGRRRCLSVRGFDTAIH